MYQLGIKLVQKTASKVHKRESTHKYKKHTKIK